MKRSLQICFGLLLAYGFIVAVGYISISRTVASRFGDEAVMYAYSDLGFVPSRKNLRARHKCSNSIFDIRFHELFLRTVLDKMGIITWYGEGSIVPYHFGVYADGAIHFWSFKHWGFWQPSLSASPGAVPDYLDEICQTAATVGTER